MDDLQRDFGKLEGSMEALQKSVQDLEIQVRELTNAMSHIKGGYGAIIAIATVVGGVIEFAHYFFHKQ